MKVSRVSKSRPAVCNLTLGHYEGLALKYILFFFCFFYLLYIKKKNCNKRNACCKVCTERIKGFGCFKLVQAPLIATVASDVRGIVAGIVSLLLWLLLPLLLLWLWKKKCFQMFRNVKCKKGSTTGRLKRSSTETMDQNGWRLGCGRSGFWFVVWIKMKAVITLRLVNRGTLERHKERRGVTMTVHVWVLKIFKRWAVL